MKKKYIVELSAEERERLEQIRRKGKGLPYRRTHAGILRLADQAPGAPAWIDEQVAQAVGVTRRTVENVRQRLVEQGFEAALGRKKRETPPVEPKLTGETEARVIALACSPAPEGRARWTLALLAEKSVELNVFDSISATSIGKVLKKTNSSPIGKSAGASRRGKARSS